MSIKYIIHNSLKKFPLKKNSVNTVITSPPYFDQRSYTGAEGQIGNEESIDQYIENIAEISNNVWDVLKDDGSYFLNIGDKYENKSLQLVPYLVAHRLTQDGWILRNTIAWIKTNSTPTAVKDRLKNTYEPVFHFVKSENYYYNLDAIRMPHQTLTLGKLKDSKQAELKTGKKIQISTDDGLFGVLSDEATTGYKDSKLIGETDKNIGARGGFAKNGETTSNRYADGGKNPGDVFIDDNGTKTWDFVCECKKINTFSLDEIFLEQPEDTWFLNIEQSKVKHTAMFPKKLVEKMIRATTKEGDVVLDPFAGSGTTNIVAESLGRDSIGFDIAYSEVREQRLNEIEKGLFV